MMTYFKAYADSSAAIEMLSDAEAGRLYKALLRYINGAEIGNLSGQERIAFAMLAAQIDRDAVSSQDKAETARENGRKGGRPKTQRVLDENPKTKVVLDENPKTHNKDNKTIDKDKDKDEDEDKGVTVRARTRFTPPTPDDVRAYCSEQGYRVDAERFVAYYESNGWRVGKNPMKDWRAAVRTWTRNDVSYSAPPSKTPMSASDKARAFLALAGEDGDGA